MSGTCSTVGHFYAFLPDIPKIFVTSRLSLAVLPRGGCLRAQVGVIAPDGGVAGVHLLPKVLFDAALPSQRPPPGQQRPQASPAGAVPRAWAALRSSTPEAKSQLLLLTPAVQPAVRAPGG